VWWPITTFSAVVHWYSECKTKNWHITLQVSFNHLQHSKLFVRPSILLANFSWKSVTRFLAESRCLLWYYWADFGDKHLATLCMAVGDLPHLTIEHRHLWRLIQRDSDNWQWQHFLPSRSFRNKYVDVLALLNLIYFTETSSTHGTK